MSGGSQQAGVDVLLINRVARSIGSAALGYAVSLWIRRACCAGCSRCDQSLRSVEGAVAMKVFVSVVGDRRAVMGGDGRLHGR
jgi:hypothetical protein